jgi:3',5'-cyclic AMP phosphodiesterase CpdA
MRRAAWAFALLVLALGRPLLAHGDLQEHLALLDERIRIEPQNASLHLKRAEVLRRLRRFREASLDLAAAERLALSVAPKVAPVAGSSPVLVRGPYLQLGTSAAVTVRWRTDVPCDSRVRYGISPSALTSTQDDVAQVTDHEVRVTGLSPDTRVFYSIGTTAETLLGDATTYFVTSPVPGVTKPLRIWVLGDSGTANAAAASVRDSYVGFTGVQHTDLWLMLGDNAYTTGTDSEYQAAVFDMYPATLRTSVLWPTLGNHDGYSVDSIAQSGPYYDMFTLPKAAEAGGAASGTEAYYSFDAGNVHFICLDSFDLDRSASSAMMTWLTNDLASTSRTFRIAFWHHPPYSKGSHDSDVETELVEMRVNALPILEAAGVDLVLSGHSHSYERSYLIDGHYGISTTFNAVTMLKDGGSGRADDTGAYHKPTGGSAHKGAVYTVAGSSGQVSSVAHHPVMYAWTALLGSLVLDVAGRRLDARFVKTDGSLGDYFTIVKGGGTGIAAPTIAGVSPAASCIGAGPLSLVVAGTNFVPGSVVRWNGAPRTATFADGSQIVVTISSSDLAAPGSASITVAQPAAVGGVVSSPVTFAIGGDAVLPAVTPPVAAVVLQSTCS